MIAKIVTIVQVLVANGNFSRKCDVSVAISSPVLYVKSINHAILNDIKLKAVLLIYRYFIMYSYYIITDLHQDLGVRKCS